MGQDLELRCGNLAFERRLGMSDWKLVDVLRPMNGADVRTVFDVAHLGEEETVPLASMRSACARLLVAAQDLAPVAERIYLINVEDRGFGTGGGYGGIRLANDPDHSYVIRASLGECLLEKYRSKPPVTLVEKIDLRGQTELRTQNFGVIKIKSRKAKSGLRLCLAEIDAFLARCSGEIVVKCIS